MSPPPHHGRPHPHAIVIPGRGGWLGSNSTTDGYNALPTPDSLHSHSHSHSLGGGHTSQQHYSPFGLSSPTDHHPHHSSHPVPVPNMATSPSMTSLNSFAAMGFGSAPTPTPGSYGGSSGYGMAQSMHHGHGGLGGGMAHSMHSPAMGSPSIPSLAHGGSSLHGPSSLHHGHGHGMGGHHASLGAGSPLSAVGMGSPLVSNNISHSIHAAPASTTQSHLTTNNSQSHSTATATTPALSTTEKQAQLAHEKRRRRREAHNAVERRRRGDVSPSRKARVTLYL